MANAAGGRRGIRIKSCSSRGGEVGGDVKSVGLSRPATSAPSRKEPPNSIWQPGCREEKLSGKFSVFGDFSNDGAPAPVSRADPPPSVGPIDRFQPEGRRGCAAARPQAVGHAYVPHPGGGLRPTPATPWRSLRLLRFDEGRAEAVIPVKRLPGRPPNGRSARGTASSLRNSNRCCGRT